MDSEKTFLAHLSDLRKTLVFSLIYIAIFSFLAFFFDSFIYDKIIFAPKKDSFLGYRIIDFFSSCFGFSDSFFNKNLDFTIQNRELTGQFNSHLWVSFVSGIILSIPFVVFEFWKFLKPAMSLKFRNKAFIFIFSISSLFFLGVLFGYFFIVPISLNFFINYKVGAENAVQNIIELSSYIKSVVNIPLASGVIFQMPIVIYVLSVMGLVTADFLKKGRKIAIIIILIVSAILTPPDVVSQIILAIPAIILYEISILLSKTQQKT